MKIYTRTGDKGETTLFTGQRILKNDPLFDAIGTVDECNSTLGMAIAMLENEHALAQVKEQLTLVQHALFDVGAALATPRTRAETNKVNKTRFDSEATKLLEEWIDRMEAHLPPLNTFILPGGHPSGATLHMARSICRRAERLVVPLNKRADVSDNVLIYLNRLSDYLFVVSRFVNHQLNIPETKWEPHKVHHDL